MPASSAKKSPGASGKPTIKKIASTPANRNNDSDPALKPFDSSVDDLFKSDLKDMLWAENHLVASLPKMIDAAKTPELKKALSAHLKETVGQVKRLKTVFEQMGIPVLPKKCDALEGLTLSGEHTIGNTRAGSAGRELGIINAGIKTEQFEITCYNGLIKMATQLGYTGAVDVFKKNLQEEQAASDKLNQLGDSVSKN